MTCIIGLVDNDNVYMGGDSAGLSGWTRSIIAYQKVVNWGGILIGCAGVPRLGQLVNANKPERGGNLDVSEYKLDNMTFMLREFIPWLQEVVAVSKFDWETEDNENTALLIGFKGELFAVCNDYSVNTFADGLYAMGQRDMAIGAMAALRGIEPKTRILKSLDIVGRYSGAVAPPYYVEKV